jgi:YfiH family protein
MMNEFRLIHWLDEPILPQEFHSPSFAIGFEGVGFSANSRFHRVKQVHGALIEPASVRTSGQSQVLPEADGLWTNQRLTPIAIKTADCLPVILLDRRGSTGVVVHAGWRGLAAGIVDRALQLLGSQGIEPSNMLIAVGPAISLPNYEVGPDVVAAFQQSAASVPDIDLALCTYKGKLDRWHIDLQGIAALKCVRWGVPARHIAVVRSCTFAKPQLWNSYRREGKVIASNWTWLELK